MKQKQMNFQEMTLEEMEIEERRMVKILDQQEDEITKKLLINRKVQAKIAHDEQQKIDNERRKRTHRLIKRGALVEMILGNEIDENILAGFLLQMKKILTTDDAFYREFQEMGRAFLENNLID